MVKKQRQKTWLEKYGLWISLLLVLSLTYAVFFADNSKVTVYDQSGNISVEDLSNPGDTGNPAAVFEEEPLPEPTECLEPKAKDYVIKPNGWTAEEKVVNTESGYYYNYVNFKSSDYGLDAKPPKRIVSGAEINFLIACTSDVSSIEELVEYETESRIFKNTDQEPTYLKVAGQDAVQYYFGNTGDSPMLTIWFANDYKFVMQYHFPVYVGSDSALFTAYLGNWQLNKAVYDQMLDSVQIPEEK